MYSCFSEEVGVIDVQPAPGAVPVDITALQVGGGPWLRDERDKSLPHSHYIIDMDQGSQWLPQQFCRGITQHREKRRTMIQKSPVHIQEGKALMTLFAERPETFLARLGYLCGTLTVADGHQDVHRPEEVP